MLNEVSRTMNKRPFWRRGRRAPKTRKGFPEGYSGHGKPVPDFLCGQCFFPKHWLYWRPFERDDRNFGYGEVLAECRNPECRVVTKFPVCFCAVGGGVAAFRRLKLVFRFLRNGRNRAYVFCAACKNKYGPVLHPDRHLAPTPTVAV